MILSNGIAVAVTDSETVPQLNGRITGKSAPPNDNIGRERIETEAFEHLDRAAKLD